MQRILYFDCLSGISGDMTLGALLDLGLDCDAFLAQLKCLNIDGYRLEIGPRQVKSITGTDFNVIIEKGAGAPPHRHRDLADITTIIKDSAIPVEAKRLSLAIFDRIAQAEAKVHGTTPERIHFHEVGAIDSLVDIVGTAIAIVQLEIDRIGSSPLPMGTGFIECAHGQLPTPAPATIEILKGVPVYATGIQGELVTPTGAAIIQTLADSFGPIPPMTIDQIGYGTGKTDFEHPNVLRVFLGTTAATRPHRRLLRLETNIDDLNPETYSYLLPLLLEQGALDVWLTQTIMKKGRPGTQVNILCEPEIGDKLEDLLFVETTTLGVRRWEVDRRELERKTKTVATRFGPVSVKVAYQDGKPLKAAPEYEACRQIARERKMPLKDVYEIVQRETERFAD
jgi:pyridinium-3,5-bisthiocarboxylic acid mononucleotide nickel chelatase